MGKNRPVRKYSKCWELLPEFKDWLSPLDGSNESAYCKVCRRPLHPHKNDLMFHGRTKKHLANMERYGCVMKPTCEISELPEALSSSKAIVISTTDVPNTGCEEVQDIFVNTGIQNKYGTGSYKVTVFTATLPETAPTETVLAKSDDSLFTSGESGHFKEEKMSSDDDSVEFFFSQWKNIPEFKDWLQFYDNALTCIACNKSLKPSKLELLKHSCGKVHKQKCRRLGVEFNSSDVGEHPSIEESPSLPRDKILIDLRSDTLTLPTVPMKKAMMNARVGDDFYREDPTVNELEKRLCILMEMEAGLLFPSGTMANIVAAITHCSSRNSQVVLGDQSHLYTASQGALARIGGLLTRPLRNEADGTFSLDSLRNIRQSSRCQTTLVCVENPHMKMGGCALPFEWVKEMSSLCRSAGFALHMDGARILNASVSCGVTPAEIAKTCSSITFCLNKGLGAPMGSVLLGSNEFIERALFNRKLLGGHLHQSGMFCAAALYSLQHMSSRIHLDHTKTYKIAKTVDSWNSSIISVDLSSVQTNVLHLHTNGTRATAHALVERLVNVSSSESSVFGADVKVLALPISDSIVRLVMHYDITDEQVDLVIEKLHFVLQEYNDFIGSALRDGGFL